VTELYHFPGFHEPFSAISHLLGALVFIVLGVQLLRRGWGDRTRVACLGVYAAACVLLLSLSGVYHMMVRGGTASRVFVRLDHGAIFVLIAASFTPAHGILFCGRLRWAPLVIMWTAAVAGITLRTIFLTSLAGWLGLTFYLVLGWFGGISAYLLGRRYGFRFVRPLLLGGVAYSIGGTMDALGWPVAIPGVVHAHELAHVAVLAGVLCHYRFVWQFATGEVQVPARAACVRTSHA